MPGIETSGLHQKLVRWPQTGQDVYAEPTHGDAEEVRCSWVNTDSGLNKPREQSFTYDAQVGTESALSLGDLVWEGGLVDLPGTAELVPDERVFQVVKDTSRKDVKGRLTRYEYGLSRYRNTLPEAT